MFLKYVLLYVLFTTLFPTLVQTYKLFLSFTSVVHKNHRGKSHLFHSGEVPTAELHYDFVEGGALAEGFDAWG